MNTLFAIWFLVMTHTASGGIVEIAPMPNEEHCAYMVAMFNKADDSAYNRYDFECVYHIREGVSI